MVLDVRSEYSQKAEGSAEDQRRTSNNDTAWSDWCEDESERQERCEVVDLCQRGSFSLEFGVGQDEVEMLVVEAACLLFESYHVQI